MAMWTLTFKTFPKLGDNNAMKRYNVQMIDGFVSSDWWKEIMEYFVKAGDTFEIRCWKEESSEIARASLYGDAITDKNEVSIKGIVTKELLEELLDKEPADKSLYNKMTKYFTINVKNSLCDICSAHYGTEMYLDITFDKDIEFFEKVMNQYPEKFSIGTV